MTFFDELKPGDYVVFYQDSSLDSWPYASVGTVKSNVGGEIVLKEISGWTFRTSDGNPVQYELHPELSTYIVPTNQGLIDRVHKQRNNIQKYREMRTYLEKIDWNRVGYTIVEKVHGLVPHPQGYLAYSLPPFK